MQFCLERPRLCCRHIAASSKLKKLARSSVKHKTGAGPKASTYVLVESDQLRLTLVCSAGPQRAQAYTSGIAESSRTGVVDYYEILGVQT